MISAIRARNAHVDLSGQRAVVVGGTSGIGEGIALRLAQANCAVTIVGRNRERGNAIVGEMTVLSKAGVSHEFVECDSFMMSNVKRCCTDVSSKYDRLDYLVLTQGIATIQGRTETSEGLDQKLAVHYFGRMAFALGLLPLMTRHLAAASATSSASAGSPPVATFTPKVLTVLSAGVHSVYPHWRDDMELKTNYALKNAADAAGLYNDLAVDALSREYTQTAFIHAAPGFVSTNWGTEMPWYIRGVLSVLKTLGRSPADCAEAMCDSLFSQDVKGRAQGGKGYYLVNQDGGEAKATPVQEEEGAREFVWTKTKEVITRALGAA